MLEIHLYGRLRSLVKDSRPDEDTILRKEYVENESFSELIHRLGLTPDDIGDCFINGSVARMDFVLSDGDRVGMFPFNMVLLCGGHHIKGPGATKEGDELEYY